MRRVWWQLTGVVVLLLHVCHAAAQDAGTLAEVEPVVQIERAGGLTAGIVGDAVRLGDRILTSGPGRARLLLRDGSVINVGLETQLVLDEQLIEPDRGVLRSVVSLAQGKLRALVDKPRELTDMLWEVHTPTAVVGVRGTEFVVAYDVGTELTDVMGISGVVEVRSRWDLQRPGVLVSGRQRSVVPRGQTPSAPTGVDEQQMPEHLRGVTEMPPGPADSLTAALPVLTGAQVPVSDAPSQLPAPRQGPPLSSMRRMPGTLGAPSYWSPADAAQQPESAIQSTGGLGVHF